MKWKSVSEIHTQTGVVVDDAHFQTEYENRSVFFHAVTVGRLATELPTAAIILRKVLAAPTEFSWTSFEGPSSTVIAGAERLLLLNPALSTTAGARVFVTARDTFVAARRDHSTAEKLKRRAVSGLADAAQSLADSVWTFAASAGVEVVVAAGDLPPDLLRYFKEATNCFSVHLDGLGVFSALRGLEATLRYVAEKKGVKLERVSRTGSITTEPLHEGDLRDIIEAAVRIRWADTGLSLVDKPTRSLLQTLRDHRNAAAHPSPGIEADGGREVALLAAKHAARLWRDGAQPRRRLKAKTVRKDWQ